MPCLVFSTPAGPCGIAWEGVRVTATALPCRSTAAVLAALRRRSDGMTPVSGDGAPEWISSLCGRIHAHLGGRPQDFDGAPLAWEQVTPFRRRIYRALLRVGPGETITYADLAVKAGLGAGHARAVGGALRANPWPLLVPCHRCVASGGRTGGFSAGGGVALKRRLLALESVARPSAAVPRGG